MEPATVDRRCRRLRRSVAALAAATMLAAAAPARAASLFDPKLRFRVVRTAHFHIHYHQGGETLAARLAAIAEDAWQRLERPLGVRPPRLTRVVIADQTELPNAYATPLPYNTIVIYPTWPLGAEFDVDDWLRLVFTHEFTHIVHLDRSESWARVVRGLFGRTPIAFPNLFLPTWQIEGLAVYEESALTGEGRLHAGEFQAIVDEAARQRALQPLDRVNGGLTDWPAGTAPYAYGSAFHQYLAERFGADTLARLADATAGRVPYTASRAFHGIFGESLGQLWRDFESARTAQAGSPRADPEATRITRHGFVTAAPRFDSACAECPLAAVYTKRTPDGFPSLNRVELDAPDRDEEKIANRYFGTTTGVGRGAFYFDQLEIRRNVGLYGDLYRYSRTTKQVERLTSEARLHDPDLSPDETTIAAVQERTARRDLVLVRLSAFVQAQRGGDSAQPGGSAPAERGTRIETLLSEPDTQFNAPRWSPDGSTIAVERHRLGHDPEIVLVDIASRAVRVAAARRGTRIVMPAWRPDARAIVAAAAKDDEPFNVFEFDLDDNRARQLTHTTGGATWPDVSSDGKRLLFVGYTVDGTDVFTMPYPSTVEGGERIDSIDSRGDQSSISAPPVTDVPRGDSYSPLGTLRPPSWTPIVEWDREQGRVGAATAGVDVLGYHQYAAAATWLVSSPSDAPTPSRPRPDWTLLYAYRRWRPTVFVSAESATTFFAGPATAAGTPSTATRRELDAEAGVVVPFIHTRSSHQALATFFRATDDYTFPGRTLSRERSAVRGAWLSSTAKVYGYSISREDGALAGATIEAVRTAFGASADATTTTLDARAYAPGFGRHHVIALRGAGGLSSGDPIAGRTFVLGGPGPDASVNDFGSGAVSLLRGFPADSFAGSRVALLNVEYRWPIARPQRGVGTWPLFLHTLHAALFADAGHAWTTGFDRSAIKTSVGGELSIDVVAGFFLPFTAALGAARGHDGSGAPVDRTSVYFRVGKSF